MTLLKNMLEYDRIDISEDIDVNKCDETSVYASIIILCIKILIIKDIYVTGVMIYP